VKVRKRVTQHNKKISYRKQIARHVSCAHNTSMASL